MATVDFLKKVTRDQPSIRFWSGCGNAAWLIRHPEDDADHVHVIVYDERRPDSILVVGQFKIATGVFVRVVVNR